MKTFIICLLLVLTATVAFAFEVGGVKVNNKLYLLHVENDTGEFTEQFEHILNVSKKDFPLWLYNRFTHDHDDALEDRWQLKTMIGYDLVDPVALVVQRHEYSYKKSGDDDVVYRFGVQFEF